MASDPYFKGDLGASFAQVFERAPLALTLTSLKTGAFVAVNEAFAGLSGLHPRGASRTFAARAGALGRPVRTNAFASGSAGTAC